MALRSMVGLRAARSGGATRRKARHGGAKRGAASQGNPRMNGGLLAGAAVLLSRHVTEADMAGYGCNIKGNGRAMKGKGYHGGGRVEQPMHYRSGGLVKNPVRKPPAGMHVMPDGSLMSNAAMAKGKR